MRLRSRSDRVDADDPTPFDEVFRREEQAEGRHDSAIEAEDYQAVGMLLRESLISLVAAMRSRADLSASIDRPQDSNFVPSNTTTRSVRASVIGFWPTAGSEVD